MAKDEKIRNRRARQIVSFLSHKVCYGTARVALVLLFGGVGLFVGIWLSEETGEDGYVPAAIAVSIGLGLLVWQKLYGDSEPEEDE